MLFQGLKWPKKGFYSIFVLNGTKIQIWKCYFFGIFRAKMTKIGIQNPKLIVTNDNQQFLAHFDWFKSIFQISDVKPKLLPVKLKVRKNGIFGAKNLFQKYFPRLFLSPNQSYEKKLGQNGL